MTVEEKRIKLNEIISKMKGTPRLGKAVSEMLETELDVAIETLEKVLSVDTLTKS